MGYAKYIKALWRKPKENMKDAFKQRLIEWRQEQVTVRIDNPTRPDRARELGFRRKPGIFMVRQRVSRGGRQRPTIRKGRRSAHFGQRKSLSMNYQWVSEQRVQKKFINCEILNSYYVADDGQSFWYEVIVVDRNHPAIIKDKQLKFISNSANKFRALRGITSAGRKARGLLHKGKGTEKLRPSKSAVFRHKVKRKSPRGFHQNVKNM